jgi:hypothetical protein
MGSHLLEAMTSQQKTLLSAYVYENQEVELTSALFGQRIPVGIAAFRHFKLEDSIAEFARPADFDQFQDLLKLHLELCPLTYSSPLEVGVSPSSLSSARLVGERELNK